jgi:alpha-tubulin suppressor-like RCC1 family protein
MNTSTTSLRTSGLRWLLALLLGAGLLALTPARADAAPLTGATNIDGLASTTCVRTSNGQARCWGEGSQGQVGAGGFGDASSAIPVRNVADTGNLTGVTQVTSGATHSCALLTTGRAVCWGDDTFGALGAGPGNDSSDTPVIVRNAANTAALSGIAQISAGNNFTCARLTSGQARCWGDDGEGQLGDAGPFSFSEHLPRIVARNSGGDPLTGITQLSTGASHACARLSSAQARCWGLGTSGQIGDDSGSNRPFPVTVKNGSGVAPLADITQVSAGGNTSCARISNGQVRCWGEGSQGQIGNNDDVDRFRPAPVRAPAGTDVLRQVTQIAVSTTHTCARLSTGQARCWGDGAQGALGNPNFSDGPTLRPVVVRNGTNTGALTGVAQVSAGFNFGCARLSTGQARCWGSDINQQLGNGAGNGSEVPVAVQVP